LFDSSLHSPYLSSDPHRPTSPGALISKSYIRPISNIPGSRPHSASPNNAYNLPKLYYRAVNSSHPSQSGSLPLAFDLAQGTVLLSRANLVNVKPPAFLSDHPTPSKAPAHPEPVPAKTVPSSRFGTKQSCHRIYCILDVVLRRHSVKRNIMSTFCAVNTSLAMAQPTAHVQDEHTPSTPKSAVFVSEQLADVEDISEDTVKTPTRESFSNVVGQKPLPDVGQDQHEPENDIKMEVVEEDEDAASVIEAPNGENTPLKEGKDGSGGESTEGDPNKFKKKKSQRFFCTDYPPCKLSFTRSEHLARHIRYALLYPDTGALLTLSIRKHTGERPFQCHCGRRFSRLDNLRQHAQTVHLNEDIPVDSPAATGSRYQRHIRTDRVRPTGRARASTFSNPNPAHQARGHSRNLSSSSITSVSTVSSYAGEDFRRSILDTPRTNRLSLDTYNPTSSSSMGVQQYYTVGANSPTGYSTPTSATFSVGTNSPRFSSGIHSPASSISRTGLQSKTPNRRLSVPGSNPFQSGQTTDSYQQSYMSPVPSAAALSRAGAQYASPISSFADPRRDALNAVEAENRRRTWHPNTTTGLGQRPASSGIGAVPVPPVHKPLFGQQQLMPSGNARLPGIESFDNLDKAPPPVPLIRRQPSPMELDPPPTSHPVESGSLVQADNNQSNRISWTSSLRKGFNQLEITSQPQDAPQSSWNLSTTAAQTTDNITSRPLPPPPVRPSSYHSRTTSENLPSIASHPDEMSESEDRPVTPRRTKRMGWYMQPPTAEGPTPAPPSSHGSNSRPVSGNMTSLFRTSPDSSSDGDGAPTPITISVETHPAIVRGNGLVESSHHPHSMEGVEEATPKQNQSAMLHHPSALPPPQPSTTSGTFRSGYPQASAYAPSSQPNPFGLPRVYESSVPAQYSHSREPTSGMNRLEALVAVATSEEQRV
jgi:C2H2 transcription facotor